PQIIQNCVLTLLINIVALLKLKSMSFFHQVEGFIVLVSCHPNGNIWVKQGSALADDYFCLVSKRAENDRIDQFHTCDVGRLIGRCSTLVKKVVDAPIKDNLFLAVERKTVS
ncbi:hypothetical protein VP01_6787g1, partial [Puccinia sorghi]